MITAAHIFDELYDIFWKVNMSKMAKNDDGNPNSIPIPDIIILNLICSNVE